MKKILLLIFILSVITVDAQDAIKNVIVETYYVSDANDATDTTGGQLIPGTKTYRIFVQLKPGCKLMSLYGDEEHALKISSTKSFFNNIDYGETFGKDIRLNNLRKNTVALDTWLTLGQTTKKAAMTYFGVLKSSDTNGSIIGGENNDGGSAVISGGLLINDNILAGLPLTLADGMDTLVNAPTNWFSHGFINSEGEDSTIFGSLKTGNEFISNNAVLSNSGIAGVDPDSNQVLVAQLTTAGEISFELNVQVYDPSVENGYRSYYVASGVDSTFTAEKKIVKVSPYLKFPHDCGCNDPNYLEYNKAYLCNSTDSCRTRIVLGCMDPNACNFNPDANVNVQSLCCYPGYCYDRDISLACPSDKPLLRLDLYPNPASGSINIKVDEVEDSEAKYIIYNYYGNQVVEKDLGTVNGKIEDELNLTGFQPGLYLVRFIAGKTTDSRMFIKY